MTLTEALLEEIQSYKNMLSDLSPNDNRSFWVSRHLSRLALELELTKNHVRTFDY
jgi:hypothetical protein